jgi:hypothetical protein
MHWRDLVVGSQLFEKQEPLDRFYWDYRKAHSPESWLSKTGPSSEEVSRLILFINQWSTHYTNSDESREALRVAMTEVRPLVKAMAALNIVDADFDSEILPGLSLAKACEELFFYIATAGKRNEVTGATKMLHMLNPHFFVMWDDAIRKGYAINATKEEYGYRFLPLMQRELRGAIGSFIAENQAAPARAVAELEALRAPRTLAKMIDEYSYMKFTVRLPELWGFKKP